MTTTPVTIADEWLNRALDDKRVTLPLSPSFAYLDDKGDPRLSPDLRYVRHDIVQMSEAQMQQTVVLAAGAPAAQVLGLITLDLIWCANGHVRQVAERPYINRSGFARVARDPARAIDLDGAERWPNTLLSSCLILHDASPSGFLRRLKRIDRERLRQALMDGTGPFGGWAGDANAAFNDLFDRFEATWPSESEISEALDHLECTKAIKRPTFRDLIVSPRRLMQANPAIATQLEKFLTSPMTNNGAVPFGQDIAAALEPVPAKPRRNLTRKERHIADRQELLLMREKSEVNEARIATLEAENLELRQMLARFEGEHELTDDEIVQEAQG
ncbi:hypothetical protein [Ruegeria sp. HKCCA5426]|uniref:hypothetical protein n=1 Tax=Ruegeria sp. HKCCA5426 TaxID=2682985 RepID=UPI001489F5C4|nr:hypothetical protein [Ruegeria sp. HKCCA5426]